MSFQFQDNREECEVKIIFEEDCNKLGIFKCKGKEKKIVLLMFGDRLNVSDKLFDLNLLVCLWVGIGVTLV